MSIFRADSRITNNTSGYQSRNTGHGEATLAGSPLGRLEVQINPSLSIQYFALIPSTIDPDKIAVIFPFGSQSAEAALGCINQWHDDFIAKGWLVISPIAPQDRLFFNLTDEELKKLIQGLTTSFNPGNYKMHLFGSSNGGVSAFRVAALVPENFQSLTIMPGFPLPEDASRLKQLKSLKINFIVGQHDTLFLKRGRKALHKLLSSGADVNFEVIAGAGHNVQHMLSFDDLIKKLPKQTAS